MKFGKVKNAKSVLPLTLFVNLVPFVSDTPLEIEFLTPLKKCPKGQYISFHLAAKISVKCILNCYEHLPEKS